MPVVIGTNVYMKLYITTYIMWAKCCASGINIYSDNYMPEYIDIPDGHFKIQDDGQVSRLYQFHMNPYNFFIVKCMCTNFDPPVVLGIF